MNKNTEGMVQYVADKEHVKMLGRTYLADNTLWLAYSGTGIEFQVTGTKAEICFCGDTSAKECKGDENCARFAVYLDGQRIADEMMNKPAKRITVFAGEKKRTAIVRAVKLSETAMSTLGITAVRVKNGEITKTESKDLFIEFIGDSITCGYGVDDEDENHTFATRTEDVTRAYAYKTAAALDADYSMVCISGYGIISGYSEDGNIVDRQRLPEYYDKLGFSYAASGNFRVEDIKWDFSVREPNIIVINLGTNDASYCKEDADRQAQYRAGYIDFLKHVRLKNPNAKIFCGLGIMGDTLYHSMLEAVKQYSEKTGDKNIDTLYFDAIAEGEGYVSDWHPTEVTHTRAAKVLADKLREYLNSMRANNEGNI